MLHVHVGSQGCEIDLIISGIQHTFNLAKSINKSVGHKQVSVVDIGGGMPVNYDTDVTSPTYTQYAEILLKNIPELCSGEYHVITEFGRSLLAKCGWVTSRGRNESIRYIIFRLCDNGLCMCQSCMH